MNKYGPAVISLFDYTGILSKPWLDEGFRVFMFDQQLTNSNQGEGLYHIGGDYREWPDTIRGIYEAHLIAIVLSQPPCTDLSCNGARWMAGKLKANPRVFDEAMELVYFGRDIAEQYSTEQYSIPYAIENPVSRVSTLWRKPNFTFHPYEFGGYLPEDHVPAHPLIPARDRYTKRTCIWSGNGFVEPKRKPVKFRDDYRYSPQHNMLGGRSLKTKNIRSMAPMGWAMALFLYNGVNIAWEGQVEEDE